MPYGQCIVGGKLEHWQDEGLCELDCAKCAVGVDRLITKFDPTAQQRRARSFAKPSPCKWPPESSRTGSTNCPAAQMAGLSFLSAREKSSGPETRTRGICSENNALPAVAWSHYVFCLGPSRSLSRCCSKLLRVVSCSMRKRPSAIVAPLLMIPRPETGERRRSKASNKLFAYTRRSFTVCSCARELREQSSLEMEKVREPEERKRRVTDTIERGKVGCGHCHATSFRYRVFALPPGACVIFSGVVSSEPFTGTGERRTASGSRMRASLAAP